MRSASPSVQSPASQPCRHRRLAQRANMRLNRLRIDPRKQRIDIDRESAHDPRRCRVKMSDRIVRPAPYIESMANFMPDFAIRSRSAKLSIAFRYGGRKSTSSIAAGFSACATGLPRYDSIAAMIDGLPDPPYHALYFTPFHCAGLCDDVIMMPPAAPRPRTPKLSAGVGVMSLASATGIPVAATTSAHARANAFDPNRVS